MSAYQLAIAIGIFLAYLVDGRLSANASWRMMLGAASVPGLLLFFVALVAPKSPRWLMKMHRREDAAREMKKIAPVGDAVETDLNRIRVGVERRTERRDLERSLPAQLASSAHDRAGPCNLPAGNGHQRHHLLRRPDFWRVGICREPIAQSGS